MWLNKGLHLSKQLHRLTHSASDHSTTEAAGVEKNDCPEIPTCSSATPFIKTNTIPVLLKSV